MRTINVFSALSAFALITSAVHPAYAAETPITLTIESGPLSITGQRAFFLEKMDSGNRSTFIHDGITVSDMRAGEVGWVATVEISAPTNKQGDVMPVEMRYTPEAATVIGVATAEASVPITDMAIGGAVQSAHGVVGNNITRWNATLDVLVTSRANDGPYTVTVVHSVL